MVTGQDSMKTYIIGDEYQVDVGAILRKSNV